MKPTRMQEDIINTPGNMIVRASAGTGKTFTMVEKIAQEIDDNKSHKSIAAITFTIKAAFEIKDRLTIDTTSHFIGTNNSFAIEEVIKPFLKDIYGNDFDKDFDTDYSIKINNFEEGINFLRDKSLIGSYRDNKKNFIFELALKIAKESRACQLYLQAKYFKLYIDEYQDCDLDMHAFFMFICDDLNIELFIVGDEKQSIYIWRGAYPDAFKGVLHKKNFINKILYENFRSCKQIQNYTNLLFEETSSYYEPMELEDNLVVVKSSEENWVWKVLDNLNVESPMALLRFSNADAKSGAKILSEKGLNCIYIPQIPISDITTESAWIYMSIAKYLILDKYSVYDFISDIPAEADESIQSVQKIQDYLESIRLNIKMYEKFERDVKAFAEHLGYQTKTEHIKRLYTTANEEDYHIAFEDVQNRNISITFHSSKGLEFEQVVLFSTDYRLNNESSLYNHYVASTRAINKLIIVHLNSDYNSSCFQTNLLNLLEERKVNVNHLMKFI